MSTFQGKRVSTQWKTVLDAAWRQGVRFQLNSGRRTMAEQRALRKAYENGSGNLAAKPNPNAPHIRVGRQNHALDVDSFAYDNGEQKLQDWLRRQGTNPQNTVPGESWHLELTAAELRKLYRKFRDPLAGYPADERRWIREYDELKWSKSKPERRKILRRTMKSRRQQIWREAQESGWRKNNRIKRYASLRARS